MFANFLHILIILFQTKRIESLFVSVGDYSNESIPGLNAPECGLSIMPMVIELSFNNKCFHKKFKDKTLVLFNKIMDYGVPQQIGQRVYKGVDVRHFYEAPWVVYISHKIKCTGSLITPLWIITAAHCLFDVNDNLRTGLELTMGSNTKKGTHRIHVKRKSFYAHPMYTNPSLLNPTKPITKAQRGYFRIIYDIALIKVSGFVPNTAPKDNRYIINTICLPKRDEVNNNPENATYYGYGRILDNDTTHYADYLQKGWVELSPFKYCPYQTPFLVCGRYSNEDPRPCPGDSGGPLLQYVPTGTKSRAIIIGVLNYSWPPIANCSSYIRGTEWTSVSQHIDWILKTMKEN